MTGAEAGTIPLRRVLRDELTLSPERTRTILRMTGLCVLVTVLSMALRVPEAAISAYMVFFVTKEDAVTTAVTGAGVIVAATVGIALAIGLYCVALGEPALRVPLMALLIFVGMFFSRVSPVGPLGFALGFICALALTVIDQVGVPELLIRGLLWLWVVVAYPTALVVAFNLLAGRRPEQLFVAGVALRLRAAAAFLAGGAEAQQLDTLQRAGAAELARYAKHGPKRTAATRAALVGQVDHLLASLVALPHDAAASATARSFLDRVGNHCRALAQALEGGDAPAPFALSAAERAEAAQLAPAAFTVMLALAETMRMLDGALVDLERPPAPVAGGTAAPRPLLADDAFTNPDHVRFALKTTLAAMLAYLVYTGLSWPGIRTAMITCFFVALDSLGETVHKLTLRIVGALVGAALGVAALLLIVPRLESIAGLVVLVAIGTLPAAWIATASPRLSYAGWQIAFAFYVCVLHGFGPSTNLVVARDRLIGILLGNVIVTVVFASLWPVRIRTALARTLGDAVAGMAQLLRLGAIPVERVAAEAAAARVRLQEALAAARRYAGLARFEPVDDATAARSLDVDMVARIEALFIPVAVLAHDRPSETLRAELPAAALSACAQHDEALARWLDDYARALRSDGTPPPAPAAAPEPASDGAMASNAGAWLRARGQWYRLLAGALATLALTGCSAWPGSLAPTSPSQPWRPAARVHARTTVTSTPAFALPPDAELPWPAERAAVDPQHVYSLAELIDIAERANPDTRVAWEQARQAALAVGVAWSEYLPILTASVVGGYQHTNFPLPLTINSKGSFAVDNFEIVPALGLKWLLFDFGGRAAQVKAARQLSVGSNASFTGVHQKIIFDVAKAFYKLNAARGKVAVEREALAHARSLSEAVESRRARGVATVVESTQARREVAQAEYDLAQASAVETDSYAELLEAIGVDPRLQLRVEDNSRQPLPTELDTRVDRWVDAALRTRPDVVVALSRLHAADARIIAAKSAFMPKIGVAGFFSAEVLGTSIEGSHFFEQTWPTASAMFSLEWVIVDGGTRYAQLKIAQSQRAEAEAALIRLQDHAVRQVIAACNEVKAGLVRYRAAEALASAADVAEDAAHEAYKNGVGTYTDALNAETARVQAHAAREQAYAEALTAAATLAFASGGLTSAHALR